MRGIVKCKCCDKEFFQSRKGQVFCNAKCRLKFFSDEKSRKTTTLCKYNDGVECRRVTCGNCGWQPDVIQKRLQNLSKR